MSSLALWDLLEIMLYLTPQQPRNSGHSNLYLSIHVHNSTIYHKQEV